MNKNKVIKAMIKTIVATRLNKTSVTWDEVEELYNSSEHPEIIQEINYILKGE